MSRIKTLAAVVVMLAVAGDAFAISEMELREKWSKSIVGVKKGACKDEPKSVHKKMDYAAMLVIHNEVDEASESLKTAAETAGSEKCRAGIRDNMTAPVK